VDAENRKVWASFEDGKDIGIVNERCPDTRVLASEIKDA
jgi:hypothetical protein